MIPTDPIPETKEPFFSEPHVQLRTNSQGSLISNSGIVSAQHFFNAIMAPQILNDHVKLFKRHSPYFESDHICNFAFNFLSGGESISDLEDLQSNAGYLSLIGADRIPDPTTAGDFLARFNKEESLDNLDAALTEIQRRAWKKIKCKLDVGTIDADSSIHEVYGEKKEGADWSYNNKWSYNAIYCTLSETGDKLWSDVRSGNTYGSVGLAEKLPGIIRQVKSICRNVRFRADSGFYDKNIVAACEQGKALFYIAAEKRAPLLAKVADLPDECWKSFKKPEKTIKTAPRQKRENLKKKISPERYKKMTFKGNTEMAELQYQPAGWNRPYRFVVKRTEIVDAHGQMILDKKMARYDYHIIATNDFDSDMKTVMRVAEKRGNQENLIKDFKNGLGLSHVPTGSLNANRAFFKIASLAWNVKTWLLEFYQKGLGAVMRMSRFMKKFIFQAAVVGHTGRNIITLRMENDSFYKRLNKLLTKLA